MKSLILAVALAAPILAHAATVRGCEQIAHTVPDAAKARDSGQPISTTIENFVQFEHMAGTPTPVIELEIKIVHETYARPNDDEGLEKGILLSCLLSHQ